MVSVSVPRKPTTTTICGVLRERLPGMDRVDMSRALLPRHTALPGRPAPARLARTDGNTQLLKTGPSVRTTVIDIGGVIMPSYNSEITFQATFKYSVTTFLV